MDAAGVEKIKVTLLQIDLIVLYAAVRSVLIKCLFGNVRLNFLRPEASVQDRLCAFPVFVGVLDAQYACKLVFKAVDGIVGALLAVFDMIDMRLVAVRFVMDAENRGTVACTVGFPCNLHLFSRGKRGERIIDEVNRVIKSVE